MAYPGTTYAKELAKWWLLYDVDLSSYRSECGGYVIEGEQLCYINSYPNPNPNPNPNPQP